MSERRITISPKVDRGIYFRFRDLCHEHGISAERGVEQALKQVLERAGVPEGDGELMESASLTHTKGAALDENHLPLGQGHRAVRGNYAEASGTL